MNQCDDRIKELLPLYYDNELSKEEILLVDTHIENCDECLEELNFYKEINEELNLDSIKAPKGFHDDLVSKLQLDSKKSKKSLYTRYNKYINVAAMLVFVIFLSVIGLTQGNKWGQTSDEAVMAKSESKTEMSMERTETKESSEDKFDAKEEAAEARDIEVEEVEEVLEAEAEMAVMEEVMEEVEEEAKEKEKAEEKEAVKEESIEETTEEASDYALDAEESETIVTFTTDDTLEESDEIYGDANTNGVSDHVVTSAESSETAAVEIEFSEAGESNENHAEYTLETDGDSTNQEHLSLQAEDSNKKDKNDIITYIIVFLVSLVLGVVGTVVIRKRFLKN